MIDYKQMYIKLFRASEEAINTLITVQRECEELYISFEDQKQKESELNIIKEERDDKQ